MTLLPILLPLCPHLTSLPLNRSAPSTSPPELLQIKWLSKVLHSERNHAKLISPTHCRSSLRIGSGRESLLMPFQGCKKERFRQLLCTVELFSPESKDFIQGWSYEAVSGVAKSQSRRVQSPHDVSEKNSKHCQITTLKHFTTRSDRSVTPHDVVDAVVSGWVVNY